MTCADADPDRFKYEDAYEGDAEREAEERAEAMRDAIEDLEAAALRAIEKARRLRITDQWQPGAPTDLGFQPGRHVSDEAMREQVRLDARNVIIPWLEEAVRALVEE